MKISVEPIGYVRNARKEAVDDHWNEIESDIIVELGEESLQGLEDFSHAEIIFYFHQADESKIVTGARHPRNNPDWPRVGIFAQRGKNRPNRIGATIVKILKREKNILRVAGLDAIDGTPILDIKPVMREFLPRESVHQPEWSTELMKNYWE